MVGETDKTIQGEVSTSESRTGSTSEEASTFTREQVEAMVSKARSDALAELGRHKKAADEAVKQMQIVEERLSRFQEERFESELEAARDDPDRLREVRQRQKEAKDRITAEMERKRWESERATYDERIKRAEAIERRDLAREVASQFGVSYSTLEKFGTDRESMVELAKSLPKSGDVQSGQANQGNRMTEPPEAGRTKGASNGAKIPSLEELRSTPPSETEKKVKSGEWLIPGWVG